MSRWLEPTQQNLGVCSSGPTIPHWQTHPSTTAQPHRVGSKALDSIWNGNRTLCNGNCCGIRSHPGPLHSDFAAALRHRPCLCQNVPFFQVFSFLVSLFLFFAASLLNYLHYSIDFYFLKSYEIQCPRCQTGQTGGPVGGGD